MAGLSLRFKNFGYTLPKYMLYAHGKSLFNHSVNSFKNYFNSGNFYFVIRDIFDSKKFIEDECELMGIKKYEIVVLKEPTAGQAETVFICLKKSKINLDLELIIFNIDTIRKDYLKPEITASSDGYLEVFKGSGLNWSYAKIDSRTQKVKLVAEKKKISNLCSSGLYFFKNGNLFIKAFLNNPSDDAEIYVAPLYNFLIKKGYNIFVDIISHNQLIFSGTPSEYSKFLENEH